MTRQFKPGQLRTGSLYNISSSFAITASYAANAGTTINTGSFVTTSSFNAFTASYTQASSSFSSSIASLTAATGSYILASQTSSMSVLSSSFATTASYVLPLTQSVFITGSLNSIGNIIHTGSALITGSLVVSGSISVLENGVNSFNTTTYTLRGSNGTTSANWNTRILNDTNNITSLDWQTRQLKTSIGLTVLDWENATFTGSVLGTASYATNALSASYALTSSYSQNLVLSGSINNVDYIDFTTDNIIGTNAPAWKEGRLFYDSGSGALAMYNWEQDVTLNIGQEQWLRARNQTGVTITNGTVVRLVGAIGDRPTVEPAIASDQTNFFSIDNEIIGMATHDIEHGTDGFITTFGLVNGINTSAFNVGDLLWVSQSAGQFTSTPPSPPFDKTFVGIVTRKNANNGSVFMTPLTSIHFHDISSVSASRYQMGDLWMYRSGSVGQANAWINTKALTGSYSISGSLTATSFTGSLLGTASFASAVPASGVIGLNLSQIATGSVTASVSPTQFTVTSGSVTEFVVRGTGVTIGSAITDTHFITGSAQITGSLSVTGSLFVTGVSSLPRILDYYANTGSSGQILASDGTNTKWTAVKNTSQIQINSEGPTVVSGSKAFKYIDNEEYITKVTIKSVYTGSIQFILRSPGIIYGSASLNNNVLYEDTTLTGWNRTIPSGSMIEFVVGTSGGISSGSASTFLFLINTISKIL